MDVYDVIKTIGSGSFGQVNFLICIQQIFILAFLCLGHSVGILKLVSVPFVSNTSFLGVFASFVVYVLTSLQGLKYVSLPLYTVLRKTGVLLTVILEWIYVSKKRPTAATSFGVTAIVFGAIISGFSDLNFDAAGYALCLACNLATSGYIISISRHKQNTSVDTPNLIFQCAICAIPIFFLISVVSGEFNEALKQLYVADVAFILAFSLSSLLAGLLNIAAVWNTRLNSPTTQSISANFKDVLVVIISQYLQPVDLVTRGIAGLLLTFLGACVHSFQDNLKISHLRAICSQRIQWPVFISILSLSALTVYFRGSG